MKSKLTSKLNNQLTRNIQQFLIYETQMTYKNATNVKINASINSKNSAQFISYYGNCVTKNSKNIIFSIN